MSATIYVFPQKSKTVEPGDRSTQTSEPIVIHWNLQDILDAFCETIAPEQGVDVNAKYEYNEDKKIVVKFTITQLKATT